MLIQEQDVELKEKKKKYEFGKKLKKSDKKVYRKQEMRRKENLTVCFKIIQNYAPLWMLELRLVGQ